ncbi:unnamed protein product [Brassica rapa subsp. trilocularis]
MLLVEYASSKEVIYITRTHILRSSLDCVYTVDRKWYV